ncbi:MAG: UDP-3-O-(3-hydroxymyristoyl)glucosamine N-acyltransferase [Bacteroidales bacterium]|nr:UDP-3-O-(3-hydroxymyristoyl)glucosamine N-acyltransferase [Bacteroidales bacterium]
MEFSAKQIAEFVQGEIVGDPDARVNNVSKIEEGKPGTLSFLANPKYEKYVYETSSSIVLINESFEPEKPISATLIKVKNAYDAFAKLLELYDQMKPKKQGTSSLVSIHETAVVGEDAYIGDFVCISQNVKIGNKVKIYPQVYLGDNTEVGDNTIIYPGVKIYNDCKVGANCIIHGGVIIGSDGFGFAGQEERHYRKIPQLGNVIIEDDVEIGANVTIDRATMGSTVIRRGVKIDNLIQIAHNVEIGEDTVVIAQAGIAGSTKIGKKCIIAAQAGIVGHLNIEDEVIIGAQAGVSRNQKKGAIVIGSPAFPISEFRRSSAIFKTLPELRNMVLELQREVAKLKGES